MKKASVLKIYLRLTKMDSTTLSKGKMILNNFSEELKPYSTVKVKPGIVS